jgi:hypothetical protein
MKSFLLQSKSLVFGFFVILFSGVGCAVKHSPPPGPGPQPVLIPHEQLNGSWSKEIPEEEDALAYGCLEAGQNVRRNIQKISFHFNQHTRDRLGVFGEYEIQYRSGLLSRVRFSLGAAQADGLARLLFSSRGISREVNGNEQEIRFSGSGASAIEARVYRVGDQIQLETSWDYVCSRGFTPGRPADHNWGSTVTLSLDQI